MSVNLKKSFLFHLAIVVAICIVLYVCFFVALHKLTAHGQEVIMPGVTGKHMDIAVAELDSMHFKVSVDSTYEPAAKPLAVLKQLPDSGAVVKDGRIVMLTVNMLTPPSTPMPSLVGLSYKSAEMLLRNCKLLLGDTTWRADVNSGAILEQSYKGRQIKAGDILPQGSKISLVVGDGAGNTQHNVPDVTSLSVDAARTILSQYNVQIEITLKDPAQKITDTGEASVFDQVPKEKNEAGLPNRIKDGDKIILIIN